MKMYKFERELPDFQQIFDDFGEGIGKTFAEGVKDPMVKRAMTTLGAKSGEARASKALQKKVADKIVGQNVLLQKGLEYLDISSVEGLELMNDPTLGPVIRNMMAQIAKGAGGLLGGGGGGGSVSSGGSVGYG